MTSINITFTAINDGTVQITLTSNQLQTRLSAYEGLRTAIAFLRMGIGLAFLSALAWTRKLWDNVHIR